MKRVLHIAVNDLRLMVRDKTFFFWALVFPMLFILLFGNIYREDSARPTAALVVLNQDEGPWGAAFIEKLGSPGLEITVVDTEPEDYIRMLVLPPDFSRKIEDRKAQYLILKKSPGTNVRAAAQAETRVIQGIARLISELILHGDRDPADFFRDRPEFRDILEIRSRFPDETATRTPSGFDHVIPGILVHFIMMMVLIYGGVSVQEDRRNGVLTRLLYGPLSRSHIFGGKFLGRLMMGLLQALILIAVGILFFSLNLGNIVLSTLNVIVFAMTMAALSILLGSLIAKEDLMIGLSILLANLFAGLGGCWWPIEVVPPTVRALGVISPAYWAMDAFHKVIFFDKGASDVLVNFAVLLSFTAVFAAMAGRWFRLRD